MLSRRAQCETLPSARSRGLHVVQQTVVTNLQYRHQVIVNAEATEMEASCGR